METEEVRHGVDLNFARMEDAMVNLQKYAPLNDAEQQHLRFLMRDLAKLIDDQVTIGGGA